MDWNEKKVARRIGIGDGAKQEREAMGLLLGMEVVSFPKGDQMAYRLRTVEGDEVLVMSSAAIGKRLGISDIGEAVRIRFVGWATPDGGGKAFKDIRVDIAPSLTPEWAAAFPDWRKIEKPMVTPRVREESSFSEVPAALGAEDDDLPF